MKLFIALLIASVTINSAALAYHRGPVRPGYPPPHYHDHDDDGLALFATTTALLLLTTTHEDTYHRHSLMLEAAPLAADFLTTGTGLENPALVAAMLAVRENEPALSMDELALRVIEEANK